MYLSVPDIFFVPVYYDKDDILHLEKILIWQEYNYDISFKNKLANRKDLVIGVSLPTQREDRWVRDKETMENYAKEKGVILKIENADTDVAKQALQVENLISLGIDILILGPTDSSAAVAMIKKAHSAGIKVIAYDRLIENSDLDLYVSFDNTKIGELQGRFLTQKVPKGNYIILSGDPKDNNSKLLKEGAMEYIGPLAAKRDIKIVTDKAVDNWEPKNAFSIVKHSLIENNNKIDAILAPNDATAGAAIEALETQGLAGKIPVTGQDADLAAAQRIVQGTQAMTVFKDTRQLSKMAINSAIKLAKGEALEINDTVVNVASIILGPTVVDRNNINEVLIASGYLKPSEVYKMYYC